MSENKLEQALITARKWERETGDRCYVEKRADGSYNLTDKMPYLGEWWDAEGIKHG